MTETKPANELLTDRLNNTRTKNRPICLKMTDRNPPMTDDKLFTRVFQPKPSWLNWPITFNGPN